MAREAGARLTIRSTIAPRTGSCSWLKLLSLLTLALVGAPTVASAHGGHGEPTTGWEYVAENANVDLSVAAGTSEQNHFFEAPNRIQCRPGIRPTTNALRVS